jgi:uncharacterized phage protein (TIGR01671 family)
MREIKFRAWDGERMKEVTSMGWIDGELDYISTPNSSAPADEFNLMQYTDLKDKNGKEIFEGDVFNLSHKSKNIYFVEYKNDRFWLSQKSEDNDPDMWSDHYYRITLPVYCKNYEIIGNIYENPELLDNNK